MLEILESFEQPESLSLPENFLLWNTLKENYTVNSIKKDQLLLAVQNNNIDVATKLLRENVDPNFVNNEGFVPLKEALDDYGSHEMVELLLKYNASPNIKEAGFRPLIFTNWAHGNVSFLFMHGADPNLQDR